MRIAWSICAVAAAALLLAASAPASVVSVETVDGSEGGEPVQEHWLSYTALVGEANQLRVDRRPDGRLLISDLGVKRIFEDEDWCEQESPVRVVCSQPPADFGDFVGDMSIVLGDRADVAVIRSTDLGGVPLSLDLYAGSGPDVLRVRTRLASIYGGRGDDRIRALDPRARRTTSTISCGPGRDRAVVLRSMPNAGLGCERLIRRP
jgi:hypothetical protein